MDLTQPANRPVDDRNYVVHEDYVYEWVKDDVEYQIRVFKGVITDGASVPQFLWITGIRPDGLIRAAALLHDLMYRHMGELNRGSDATFSKKEDGHWKLIHTPWEREAADRLFGRLLREAKYPSLKRKLAYKTVRFAGRFVWGS